MREEGAEGVEARWKEQWSEFERIILLSFSAEKRGVKLGYVAFWQEFQEFALNDTAMWRCNQISLKDGSSVCAPGDLYLITASLTTIPDESVVTEKYRNLTMTNTCRVKNHVNTFEIQHRVSKLQPQTHLPTHVRHASKQCFSSPNDK